MTLTALLTTNGLQPDYIAKNLRTTKRDSFFKAVAALILFH